MSTFLGMRGDGDWVTDARPKSWREMILKRYPNGKAPLTAILSKMTTDVADDPQFFWWTETFQNQGGALTDVGADAAFSATGGGSVSAGDVLYVKMAEATAGHFRAGHEAILRNTSDYDEDCVGKIMQVVKNGVSSYVAFKALQASDGIPDSDDFNRILIIGNINPEGADIPDPIAYDPVKWYNFTQIFRTPLSITGTAMNTRLRTGDQMQKAKADALEYHSIEMEKAMLFGYPSESTGANGKKERTTLGLVNAIKGISNATFGGYPGATVDDYNGTTSNFPTAQSGSTWLDAGEEWIDDQLEIIFRYGDTEKLAFCGNGVLRGIARLIKNNGNFDFTPKTTAYGIKVIEWVTNFGTVNFIPHPLFNLESSLRKSAVVFEPRNITYRPIKNRDTHFRGDVGSKTVDADTSEYLTEAGLEFYHPIGWGWLTGFNTDG